MPSLRVIELAVIPFLRNLSFSTTALVDISIRWLCSEWPAKIALCEEIGCWQAFPVHFFSLFSNKPYRGSSEPMQIAAMAQLHATGVKEDVNGMD